VIFAIGKTILKSIFISSERDRQGRRPYKPVTDISDKSLWEMCSYLPQCSANFAMETLY
jgi:hypothetical protein